MQERYVGRSGLRVSAVGLGTRTWGASTDAEVAAEQLRRFADAGGTLVDTACTYAGGLAEQVLGDVLAGRTSVAAPAREDLVLVTKAGVGPGSAPAPSDEDDPAPGPPRPDSSARSLLAALDRTLERLGTDHVDVWMAHGWDGAVPVEETVRALQAAVGSGRARYAGITDHSGWQLATAASAAGALGPPLVAAAHELSLVARGAQAEVLPAAIHHGLGVLAWAPLGRGVLGGRYRGRDAGSRAGDPTQAAWVAPHLGAAQRRVVQAVVTAAEGLGVAPVEVALAWVLGVPGVAAAVVGLRSPEQLEDVLLGEALELPVEIRTALDDASSG